MVASVLVFLVGITIGHFECVSMTLSQEMDQHNQCVGIAMAFMDIAMVK